ncbi:hypothetical protein N6P31_01380 [Pectobacterium betavasculorum]|uniref:hypothetical protein n=1 Tax=Pectobacterium betavasculorum TaxID=55207 RepID=UPI00313B8504
MKIVMLLIPFLIGGCSSSYFSKMNDPTRKDVNIDGYEIHVLHSGGNTYEAFGGETLDADILKLKKAQISAIERVSGCKVEDSEYSNFTFRKLNAEVSCK